MPVPADAARSYALVAGAVMLAMAALVWLVLGFLRRGENNPSHIKHMILAEDLDRNEADGSHDEG